MRLWKVNCLDHRFPGMWQRWFRNQAVGIGWPPGSGFHLEGSTGGGQGWTRTRNCLLAIAEGDKIIVSLSGHRVALMGDVVKKEVSDDEWDPLVEPSKDYSYGEMGRRILVRWDLMTGPQDRERVVSLPSGCRLTNGELRPTISLVNSVTLESLNEAMNDERNWTGLTSHFSNERAMSEYISAYPHRLEDGMLQHPNEKVRERVFEDRSRLDVLLMDRNNRAVIVECKQGTARIEHLAQIRHYMDRYREETGIMPRGILVHGGARRLSPDLEMCAHQEPKVETVQFDVQVSFRNSD